MADAEAKRKYNQEYRQRNREWLIQKDHEYAMTHREQKQKYNRKYYAARAEAMREYARQWRKNNPEITKQQWQRRKLRDPYSGFSEERKTARRAASKKYRENNREEYLICCDKTNLKRRASEKMRRRNLKLEAFNNYGGKCACCGESTIEFLEMDHEGGWGHKHRDHNGRRYGGQSLWRWMKKNNWPSGFRVLCGSCHSAISYWGYCPHQTPASAVLPCATLITDAPN